MRYLEFLKMQFWCIEKLPLKLRVYYISVMKRSIFSIVFMELFKILQTRLLVINNAKMTFKKIYYDSVFPFNLLHVYSTAFSVFVCEAFWYKNNVKINLHVKSFYSSTWPHFLICYENARICYIYSQEYLKHWIIC